MKDITYSHEHMIIDLSSGKNNQDCYLNILEEGLDELSKLKKLGVTRICDCSNNGIGKNYETIDKISELTGIKIIKSTGFYKDPFLPAYVNDASIEDLVDIMLEDIKNGAQIIGEIGTSKDEITDNEMKVFEAACIVANKNKLPIITHTTLGTMALEQIEIFKKYKVNLNRVIISHLALKNDLGLIEEVLKTGCNVAFDTIGKLSYLKDEIRAEFIKELVDKGYEKQLLMSMDLTRQSHLKKNGGPGYSYLIEEFVPLLLKCGVSQESINTIMSKNFSRILEA